MSKNITQKIKQDIVTDIYKIKRSILMLSMDFNAQKRSKVIDEKSKKVNDAHVTFRMILVHCIFWSYRKERLEPRRPLTRLSKIAKAVKSS